jgi:hypothetical protein
MAKKNYSGINIQYPISRLILDCKKVIETRTYPIPSCYVGQEMALIETPGKQGNFKARVVAIIKFGPSFKYVSKKNFYADSARHCVTPDSPWAWNDSKEKWGWPILDIVILRNAIPLKKRTGIVYSKNIVF